MSTTEIVAVIGAVLGGPAAVGAVKAWERVQTKRIEAEDESGEHAECRREVAQIKATAGQLAAEVSRLSQDVATCRDEHKTTRAEAASLRAVVDILIREVRGHDTDPPNAPAE